MSDRHARPRPDARQTGTSPGPAGRKPYRRPQKDPVRILAFEALRAVDERDAYANLVLPAAAAQGAGAGKGRDFDAPGRGARHRAGLRHAAPAGHVRRDHRRLRRPAAARGRPAGAGRARLGAHQLLGTRIPTHAAVSATVELARVVLGDGRAKFVNAVLRKIAAATTWTAGWSRSRRPTTRTPRTTSPSCTRTRAGSSPRCGTPSAAAGPASRTCWRPTTSGPR